MCGRAPRRNQRTLTTSRALRADGPTATIRKQGRGQAGPRPALFLDPSLSPRRSRDVTPWGLQRVCAERRSRGRAGSPNVVRESPPARETTRQLENGDRGGWPPFSKHRCLGRGGCPSHCHCVPGRGLEPKVMDWRPLRWAPEWTSEAASHWRESGAHAQCLHPRGGRGAGSGSGARDSLARSVITAS